MATPQKLKEEFLTCIVCHEVFRDPVTLHCGHTFCAQCVTAYTKTQKQAIAEKSIPCAHCRGLTKVPDPTRPVDEWAGQFKTGFFVKGLVEAVVTDKKDEDVCTPCQGDGEVNPAVFWCCDCGDALCSACEKVHRKLQSTKHHEVISLSDGGSHFKKSRKRFTCPKHPDAVIDMMCEDCDVAVCHRCCILYHRKCESVITLEEYMPKLKSVIEAHGIELQTLMKDVSKELSAKMSRVRTVEKEAEEAITAIEVIREKIFAEVRKQEKQLKEKVKKAKDEVLQHLKEDIKSGEMKLEEAKQRQGLIKEAMKSDIPMNHYEMYKICRPSNVSHTADTTSDTERKVLINIKLEDKSDNIVSGIRDMSFAVLSLSGDEAPPVGPVSKPTLLKTIDTGFDNIWDVLVLTVHDMKVVIVSPWGGSTLTSFYLKQGEQCKSIHNTTGTTYSLTRISSDKCAVAIHSTKNIEFLLVTPDLRRERIITTSKQYIALACLDSTSLAASTENPGFVDVIDMSGTVLRSFGSDIFIGPVCISVTTDNTILVSDCSRRSVTGITSTGISKLQYPLKDDENIREPRGISSTRYGDIFVADCSSGKVFQLTDTGKFVRCILSGVLESPFALFVDDDNLLYVSTDRRMIQVYEFK